MRNMNIHRSCSYSSSWCSEVHVCLWPGLDFHEDLHRIGAKEGLKGRKLQKAMESYAWNITVLKVGWPFTNPLLHFGKLFNPKSQDLLWRLTSQS